MQRHGPSSVAALAPSPFSRRSAGLLLAVTLAVLPWSLPAAAAEPRSAAVPQGRITLDETVISGNQELPKVLYILPWRGPEGLPEIDLQTEFSELEVFRRLYPPAYRRELKYFETLEGSTSEE